IDHINQNFAKHVVTIEEPIEFVHDNKQSTITQREVPENSSSFAAGLRRHCARTPILYWWERCAIWKQFHSPLRRLRPAFSYSARCTQIMRARRLTGWWMFFRLIDRRRRAQCWRTHFAAWSRNYS